MLRLEGWWWRVYPLCTVVIAGAVFGLGRKELRQIEMDVKAFKATATGQW